MSDGGNIASKGAASGRGSAVSTKGLISRAALPPSTAPQVQGDPLVLSLTSGPIRIVIPTAINTALMVVENIVANLRVQQAASTVLPSMYKRAYLIAYETDEIAVVKP